MNWKSEQTRRPTRQMQLVYIESELKNYYWHLAEWQRYENQLQGLKKRYQEELEHPSCSSSIIRMPDGSGKRSPWQVEWSGRIHELQEKQKVEERYLSRVDSWLSVCTPSQEIMVRQYVMVQQCTDAALAAEITGYTEENVRKTRERVLNKILDQKSHNLYSL